MTWRRACVESAHPLSPFAECCRVFFFLSSAKTQAAHWGQTTQLAGRALVSLCFCLMSPCICEFQLGRVLLRLSRVACESVGRLSSGKMVSGLRRRVLRTKIYPSSHPCQIVLSSFMCMLTSCYYIPTIIIKRLSKFQ